MLYLKSCSVVRISVKSKFNPSLPLEPLVKIVNLGVEQHTISIDINIRLELPADSESQEMEDMGKVDRTYPPN